MKHIIFLCSGLFAQRQRVNIQEEIFPEILHEQREKQLANFSACAAQAAWCPLSCSNCWHITHQFKHVIVRGQPGVRPTVCSDAAFAASAVWGKKHSLESHNTSNYLCRLHDVLDLSLTQAGRLILSCVVSWPLYAQSAIFSCFSVFSW